MVNRDEWLFQRALARVEPGVEEIVADFATSYVGRAAQRHNVLPPRPPRDRAICAVSKVAG